MIGDLTSSEIIPYAAVFLISFAFIIFLLNRTALKENKGVGVVIAGAASLLIIWSLANYTAFFQNDFFYNFSFENSEFSSSFVWLMIILAGLLVFFLVLNKEKMAKPMLFLGIGLIVLRFLPFIISESNLPYFVVNYGNLFLVIGIILAIFSIIQLSRSRPDFSIKLAR